LPKPRPPKADPAATNGAVDRVGRDGKRVSTRIESGRLGLERWKRSERGRCRQCGVKIGVMETMCATCQVAATRWEDFTLIDEEGREVLASVLAKRYMRWRPYSRDFTGRGSDDADGRKRR